MVHGSAGSTAVRRRRRICGRRPQSGREFDLTPSSLTPLEPFRDYLTIVSNTDVRNAEAFKPPEIGGDHFRSSAVFLTQSHPKQTQGSDVHAGISLDQIYAQRSGRTRRFPSMQLCIENVDQAGGCAYGYSCVYTDTISWASPTEPLPMIRDPRVGVRSAVRRRRRRRRSARRNRRADRSILDWITGEVGAAEARARPRRPRAAGATIWTTSARSSAASRRSRRATASGEPRQLPDAPIGVPDAFDEHVKLMFDLQVLAFAADITRVFSFKLGARRLEPRVSGERRQRGVPPGVAPRRTRGRIIEFAKINRYHVSMVPYLLEKLKKTPDGDGTCSTTALIIYGSPMGDSNLHNHKRCPLFLAGHAGGKLKGNLHLKAPDGTPMANVMLTLLHMLGLDDIEQFGDSTGDAST